MLLEWMTSHCWGIHVIYIYNTLLYKSEKRGATTQFWFLYEETDNGHYNAITDIKAFMGVKFYCSKCLSCFNHKEAFEMTSDDWAGFHQWKDQGRKVKKGAKGCKIFMICEKKVKAKNSDDDTKKKVLKALYVFNKEHTEEI